MSNTKTYRLSRHYKRTLEIDDGVDDVIKVPSFVRRFTKDELQAFEEGWNALKNPRHELALARKHEGDEQEREEIEISGDRIKVFKVSNVEVRRRRLAEMTPEQFEAFEKAEKAHVRACGDFFAKAITDHIWVRPEADIQIDLEGGGIKQLKTGADILEFVGGNSRLLQDLAALVWNENTMSPEAKKASRLRRDSTASSAAPMAAGEKPAATAGSVESGASAAIADAMASRETSPSGPIETSS